MIFEYWHCGMSETYTFKASLSDAMFKYTHKTILMNLTVLKCKL